MVGVGLPKGLDELKTRFIFDYFQIPFAPQEACDYSKAILEKKKEREREGGERERKSLLVLTGCPCHCR